MPIVKQLTRPETLLILLWAVQVVRMAWPGAAADHAGAVVAVAYVLRVFVLLRRPTVILCSGSLPWLPCSSSSTAGPPRCSWASRRRPCSPASSAPSCCCAPPADQLRQIANARELFERLEPDHRLGGLLVGTHLLAVVLGPGAYAITAPIVGASKVEEEHLAAMRACHRGGGLAGLWSPFWIAMALSSQYVPGVPLWQIMALGMSMAVCALTASHVLYSKEPGITLLWRALRSLQPIVPPVAVCVLLVAVLSGITVLSSLEALIVSVPALCLLTLLPKGRRALRTTLANTYRGAAYIGNEITILTVSLALGGVVRHVFAQTGITGWIGGLDLPAVAVIAIIIGTVSLGALAGVHQIVSVTFLLTVFSDLPGRVADVVLIQTALVSWSCSSMIGLSAIMVATATTMFRVPPEKVILGPNLQFAAMFAAAAILVLAGVNALLG